MPNTQKSKKPPLKIGMKIVISYFIFVALFEMVWQIFAVHSASFEAKSIDYKIGSYFGQALFQFPNVLVGIGLMFQKRWAEYLGYVLLFIATLTLIPSFYYGILTSLTLGTTIKNPSNFVMVLTITISVVWHGIFTILLYRNRTARSQDDSETLA